MIIEAMVLHIAWANILSMHEWLGNDLIPY